MNQTRLRRAAVLAVAAIALTGCREQPEPREPGEATTQAQPVVTADPDAVPTESAGTSDIPDGFPLAAGWPDDGAAEPGRGNGLTEPTKKLQPMRFVACGDRMVLGGGTDRLGARWRNVEDYRARQLTTYATAEDAAAVVAALVALHRVCPTEERADDGYTTIVDVIRQEVGGDSWAIVHRFEFQDAPAVGLGVHLVVRLGRSVLVDEAWNESGAGPDPDVDVRSQVREQLAMTSEVVAAMCTFTIDGCS